MRDAALLSFVGTGQMEDVALYNLGISFFMLDTVRGEVASRLPAGGDAQRNFLSTSAPWQEDLSALPENQRDVFKYPTRINCECLRP